MIVAIDVRPEVARFAILMEMVLKNHDDKYGGRKAWRDNTIDNLFRWMIGETKELSAEMLKNSTMVSMECADVANLAMMIADNSGGLPEIPDVIADDYALWQMVRVYHGWPTDKAMVDAVGYDLELHVAKMRLALKELK